MWTVKIIFFMNLGILLTMSFYNLKGYHKILIFCIHILPLVLNIIHNDQKSAPDIGRDNIATQQFTTTILKKKKKIYINSPIPCI